MTRVELSPVAREAYNLGMSALLFAFAAGLYLAATGL